MLNANAVGQEVTALGRLIGLLTGPDDDLTLNTQWFQNPATQVEQAPTRLNNLSALLGDVLGPGVAHPPNVFDGSQWYSIPDPRNGQKTLFHLVTGDPKNTTGQLGLGLLYPVQMGKVTINAFCYVPLFAYSSSGASFVTASTDHSTQIGLSVTSSDTFQVGGVSFTAFQIEGDIFLANKVPGFQLSFSNLQGAGTLPSTYTTLAALLDPTVESWIGEVIVEGSGFLYQFVGGGLLTQGEIYSNEFATNTVGDLLTAANFLTKDKDGVYHLSLQNLQGQTPEQIALNFVFAFLDALANLNFPVLSLPGGGLYITKEPGANGSTNYGLRTVVEIPLISGSKGADGKATPEVDFCLGTWLTGETDANNWLQYFSGGASLPHPGLSVLLLNRASGNVLSFAPSFILAGVGLNVKGGADQPLVDVKGVTLKEVGFRLYLNPGDNITTPSAWQYGFAARLDRIGVPIGSSFAGGMTSGGGNAVAKSLVSSGDNASGASGGDAAAGKTDAVNPQFSLEAAYLSGKVASKQNWFVELLPPNGAAGDIVWFPVNRKFGPVECQKIGVGWNQANLLLELVLDGGVTLSALSVQLVELSVGIPLSDPTTISSYHLDLKGLDVSYLGAGVEIQGGFLRAGTGDNVEYDGLASIKVGDFGIGALGSYATLPGGGTSLFVFAYLNAPLGGPPAFFVTGLAAGFGFNRSLIAPAFNQVADFPLVKAMQDPAALGLTPGQPPDLSKVLGILDSAVPPTRGEYWLAAGVMFTSFELIKSNVLLAVEFGNEFEILILGTSVLRLPQVGSVTMAYAELEIEVVIAPALGLVEAIAVLSPNSYVLDPACHLTGGFAFCIWFGANEHAGDFVLTIGGYHPAFKKPAWYPDIPRLGFIWKVSTEVEIKGGAYFALTPSCVMAGGSLSVLFSAGSINAWFDAYADMLISWKPFFYDIGIGVTIGVSVKIDFLFIKGTITVEVGADLELWGPPTGGKVHVHLWVVSFTIGFGPDKSSIKTITDWDGFKELLPGGHTTASSNSSGGGNMPRMLAAASMPAASSGDPVVCQITYSAGVTDTYTNPQNEKVWIVNPAQFAFSVSTTAPVTDATLNTAPIDLNNPSDYYVGARPMGISNLQTPMTIDISGDEDADWEFAVQKGHVPEAVWGRALPPGSTPPAGATLLHDRVTGFTDIVPEPHTPQGPPTINMEKAFTDVPVTQYPEELPFAHIPLIQGAVPTQEANSYPLLQQIMSATVSGERAAVFAAFSLMGVDAGTDGDLTNMAANPFYAYADAPMTGSPLPS